MMSTDSLLLELVRDCIAWFMFSEAQNVLSRHDF